MRVYKWYNSENIIPNVVMNVTTSTEEEFISNDEAQELYEVNFGDSVVYLPYDSTLTKEQNIEKAIARMQKSFDRYTSARQRSVDMMYRALNEDYEPILNYDKKMTGKIINEKHKGTRTSESSNVITTPNVTVTETETPNTTVETIETPNHTVQTTETPNKTTTTVETPNTTVKVNGTSEVENKLNGKNTEDDKTYGFNSSEGINKDSKEINTTNTTNDTTVTENTTATTGTNETEVTESGTVNTIQSTTGTNNSKTTASGTNQVETKQTGSTTTTKDKTSNYIETTDISDSIFDKDIQTYEEFREYGNIGVVDTASIIEKELRLRLKNITNDFILQFLNEYCCSFSCVDDMEIIE